MGYADNVTAGEARKTNVLLERLIARTEETNRLLEKLIKASSSTPPA